MSARLNIELFSIGKPEKQEMEFYNSEDWTPEAEEQLLQRMHELISELRPLSKAFHLKIDFEVVDLTTATIIVNKKLNHEWQINNHKLSMREIEVLGLIMMGYTTKEIADKLCVSYETIKSHRRNILEKTGAKNTASLINYYHHTFFDK